VQHPQAVHRPGRYRSNPDELLRSPSGELCLLLAHRRWWRGCCAGRCSRACAPTRTPRGLGGAHRSGAARPRRVLRRKPRDGADEPASYGRHFGEM
jgi:hypothetical protein